MQPRNPYVCLAIIVTLGVTLLLGVVGLILLPLYNRPTPESLIAIVSACVGSLSSFLVSVPRNSVGGEGNVPQR